MELKAKIFDIYRGTTHDGPGVRDTVFFSSCPLSCKWCHNPEGLFTSNRIWHEPKTCIGCMSCKEVCKHNAISDGETNLIIDYSLCNNCGECVLECPTKSLLFIQQEWTVEGITKQLLKDKEYYESSKGGVTVSGGECLLQADFVIELFEKLHQNKVHTALDTCGYTKWQTFKSALSKTDCLLLDLKFINADLHEKFTGVKNSAILKNAIKAAEYKLSEKPNLEIWIRTPLIPNATATVQNITEIGTFIAENMKGAVTRWELCAFNNVCERKYQRLNINWPYAEYSLLTKSQANAFLKTAKTTNAANGEIYVTGLISDD